MDDQLRRNRQRNGENPQLQGNGQLQGDLQQNRVNAVEVRRQWEEQNHRREQYLVDQRETRSMANRMRSLLSRVNRSMLTHVPEKTALVTDYKNRFTSRLSDDARLAKQRNKKSRLNRKKVIADQVKEAEEFVQNTTYLVLKNNIKEDQVVCEKDELTDLAAFMTTEDVKANREMTRLYLGENEELKNQDKKKAMDLMLEKLLTRNLGSLRLDNDGELAKNAGMLEKLSWQMAAFDRMAAKNDYFKYVNDRDRNAVEEKLDRIRSVVNYYQLRKEIINDPYYQSHYNDELSLDFTSAETEQEKEIAKKLLRAYAAGRDMMAKNGASERELQKRGIPSFRKSMDGERFLRHEQYDLRDQKTLIGDRYRNTSYSRGAEKLLSENDLRYRRFREHAMANAMNFEGATEKRKDYQEPPYDPEKVPELLEEMENYRIEDLKFGSYKEMVDHFGENYRVCERVEHLQYLISKALLNGYEGEELNNDRIMQLRIKAMCFNSIKNTLRVVNNAVLRNKEAARFSTAQWDELIRSSVISTRHPLFPVVRAFPGNMKSMILKCREVVLREEEEKEETIREAYGIFLADEEHPEISKEELQKRKDAYQKNAFIQDYTSHELQNLNGVPDPATSLWHHLEETEKKKVRLSRIFTNFIRGKSGEEVKRLFSLATGSPSQQIAYYQELLESVTTKNIKDFDGKNVGKLFEGWVLKDEKTVPSDNEMNSIGNEIRRLMKLDKDLPIPGNYESIQEMEEDIRFRYTLACDVPSARISAFGQLPSSKWLHVLSMKDMGSFDAKKMQRLDQKLAQVQLADAETTEEQNKNRALERIITTIRLINPQNEFKPGERLTFDSDLTEYEQAMRSKYEKEHRELEAQRQKADQEAKKSGLMPVLPDEELAEKRKNGKMVEAVSETEWKELGGASYQKVMAEKDAARIARKSGGFLTAKKYGNEGLMVLKPSLPEYAMIQRERVPLRTSYNLLIKSYITLITNEDGSLKTEATEEGGICEQFDCITSDVFTDLDKRAARSRAEGFLNQTFLPEFRRILEAKYVLPDATEAKKEEARRKAAREAEEACRAILTIVTNLDDEMISRNELSMLNQIKEGNRFLSSDPARVKEYLSGIPIKEKVMENGKEVLKERKPTEKEVEKAMTDFRKDMEILHGNLKQVRDMDVSDTEIPIPNSCSGNMRFLKAMQKLVTGKGNPNAAHSFMTLVLNNPEETRLRLRNNLELYANAVNLREEILEDYRNKLDSMSFEKGEHFQDPQEDKRIRVLCEIAKKFMRFEYHVAANISEDKEDGLITVEGMAATTEQFQTEPFTFSSLVGQYHGKTEVNEVGKLQSEGFFKYNTVFDPFPSDPEAVLKCRLKALLSKDKGVRLQTGEKMVEELKVSAEEWKRQSAEAARGKYSQLWSYKSMQRGNLKELTEEDITLLKQYETNPTEEISGEIEEILEHTGLPNDVVLFKEADMDWLLKLLKMDNPDIANDLDNPNVQRLMEEAGSRLNENPPVFQDEEIGMANLAYGEAHSDAPVNLILNAYTGTKALCLENIDGNGGDGTYPVLLQKGSRMRILKVEPHQGGGNVKWDVYGEIIS